MKSEDKLRPVAIFASCKQNSAHLHSLFISLAHQTRDHGMSWATKPKAESVTMLLCIALELVLPKRRRKDFVFLLRPPRLLIVALPYSETT